MKQICFFLFIITMAASCKKDAKGANCYTCQLSGIGGYHRTVDTCSDASSSSYHFKDANGNDLSYFCQPK